MIKKLKIMYGHTVLEMIIAIMVFSLFLFGLFAMMDFGFKNYRLIDTKGQAQGQAEVALARIASDLMTTDTDSLVVGTAMEEYLVFDTAVNPDTNAFEKDGRYPLWQGYVMYYTSPRTPGSINKKLMRKFIPHSKITTSQKMNQFATMALYLTDTYNELEHEELRIVARDIYSLTVTENSNNLIVNISLVTWKDFSEKRLAYTKNFSDAVAQETVNLKLSIMPRNTQH